MHSVYERAYWEVLLLRASPMCRSCGILGESRGNSQPTNKIAWWLGIIEVDGF